MSIRISPSILSADFANLERDLQRISSADLVHVDVMDGHFVPNLTLGLPVVQRLGEVSPVPLDLHLMIDDADRWAPRYAETGAFSVTFSAEAATDPVSTARAIRSNGARASVAVKPGTDLEPYLQTLDAYDMILVMTVEPGFGGQSFMPETMAKLTRARAAVSASGLDVWLEVDGGITTETIVTAVENGADTVVAGSAVYGGSPVDNIAALRAAAATVALTS
ncbi:MULTISPECIES: ribulose-phosphate 3-epimerase [unclassified Frigoribacterium]|uniref:ribulose-phosphate 3-epimerase n=1 Tax=unclassified Frigoribacterium TaxID=2627005 RepID=UPI0005B8D584|nr:MULTISPECIES: ribulose-phosphate 3-epimerase [unclassified Frigoribacterium]KIU04314.1 ribulose-phosphate 3-epimerase [Frigoribacterium sp. MEB024]KQN45888.1 ribulose phosphate epimerase [Frigoribacterium sp. Leaf44]MBD8539356.1 ribulose-phosphate 3-epimerase [Frigoribacterium sp. CFBP 8751]